MFRIQFSNARFSYKILFYRGDKNREDKTYVDCWMFVLV